MTFKIAKSVIDGLPYNYLQAVEAFRQAKLAHRFTGDVAPSAPSLIEQAVRRVPVEGQADDFVIDYEVINDVTLETRKQDLLNRIRSMEAAALARIISPARERLFRMELQSSPTPELAAKNIQIGERKQVIQHHAAELEVEVEDLTEDTIDGWEPKPFPGMTQGA